MSERAACLKLRQVPASQPALVRKAGLPDVGAMYRLINHYAERQLMLPKTHLQLYESLRDYTVAVDSSDAKSALGCGALHIYWENLAEIRALAVAPDITQRGIGTQMVESLLAEAKDLGLTQVFLFTYAPEFFRRFGFVQTEHTALPLKVFNECFYCVKFNTCDEIAMVLDL